MALWTITTSGGSQDFPRGGADSRGVSQPIILHFFGRIMHENERISTDMVARPWCPLPWIHL